LIREHDRTGHAGLRWSFSLITRACVFGAALRAAAVRPIAVPEISWRLPSASRSRSPSIRTRRNWPASRRGCRSRPGWIRSRRDSSG